MYLQKCGGDRRIRPSPAKRKRLERQKRHVRLFRFAAMIENLSDDSFIRVRNCCT